MSGPNDPTGRYGNQRPEEGGRGDQPSDDATRAFPPGQQRPNDPTQAFGNNPPNPTTAYPGGFGDQQGAQPGWGQQNYADQQNYGQQNYGPQGGQPGQYGYGQQPGGYDPQGAYGQPPGGYGAPPPPKKSKTVPLILAGCAIVVIAAIAAVAFFMTRSDEDPKADVPGSSSSTTTASSSTISIPTSLTTPTSISITRPSTTLSDNEQTSAAIRAATTGSCLHKEDAAGTPNPDGSRPVSVRSAVCGTSYATHKVTLRTTDQSNCNGGAWVRTRNSTSTVVLCIAPE